MTEVDFDPRLKELLRLVVELQDEVPHDLSLDKEVMALVTHLTRRRITSMSDVMQLVERRLQK